MSTLRTPPITTADNSAAPARRLSTTLDHPRPGQVLIGAHGDVDLGTVDDFRAVLIRAGRESRSAVGRDARRLVCDLSGLTFLAAVGISALVEAGDAARRHGTHLHLVAPPGPARRVLQLCGVDRELPTTPRLVGPLDQQSPEVPAPRSAW